MSLLNIGNLNLSIGGRPILKNVDLRIEAGEILGLVGESGSGKSMTALSVMRLLPHGSRLFGSIQFLGEELSRASEGDMCQLRGNDIGMVFQEPMSALNPVQTIGDQIAEGLRLHGGYSRRIALDRAAEVLESVGLPPDRFPLSRYPHELSGGQRQRVVIAIACAMQPKLLIADEPTTALDVTIQAQILKLLVDLVRRRDMALLLITHDLGVVAETANRIAIMRSGEILEYGLAREVLLARRHPYTKALAEASSHRPARKTEPVLTSDATAARQEPVLSVTDLVCTYRLPRKSLFAAGEHFRAVDGVSFSVFRGQTMGLAGESGCGKSTLARAILGLHRPAAGSLVVAGREIAQGDAAAVIHARRHTQIVFQDPYGSFNPRHRVGRIVAEPLHLRPELSAYERERRVRDALDSVGLPADAAERYPHEFSGGQRQRIAIARALVNQPDLIIADEPVSALDVSIRAQILDLLSELRDRLSIAYLFISHDLSVMRAFCDEVMVMRAGKIVEAGVTETVFARPQQEYTRELIAAAPDLNRAIATL
jgi:peptide/nickel transport system ATP-binding protein